MEKNINEKFLRLTGFEEAEMPEALPEWHKASEKLGLTEDDVKFATEEWIPAHFQVELEGIRKLLGAYVREAIDLTKANEYKQRGVKILYGILPSILHYYYAIKLTAPDKVYVTFPDVFSVAIYGTLFHKLNPYLEEAEKHGITYGCRHCSLNKMRYVVRRRGLIPSPDVSWIYGFVCDEGPKTDEFINLYCDPEWKTYVTRLPHDQPLGTVEDEVVEYVEYLANQMRDGFEFVQKELGIKVTDEKLKEVGGIYHRYMTKFGELNRLMASDPPPLHGNVIPLFFEPLGLPFNTGIERIENALDITIREVKQMVAKKQGVLPEGAPKLMFYTVPWALPWLPKMFEENGVAPYLSESFAPWSKQLQPPTFEDPYMAAAQSWLRRSIVVNIGWKAEIMLEKLETYNADGMLLGLYDFDRWLGSDHRLLARMLEEKAKVPVFYVEGDFWDDRDYGPEALRTRIESICEIMKMRKSS